jgi:hypothetical protein
MDTGPDPDRQALEGGFRSAKITPIRPDPQHWYVFAASVAISDPSLPDLFLNKEGGQSLL